MFGAEVFSEGHFDSIYGDKEVILEEVLIVYDLSSDHPEWSMNKRKIVFCLPDHKRGTFLSNYLFFSHFP